MLEKIQNFFKNNKLYSLFLFLVIVLFIAVIMYCYKKFVVPKINPEYTANKEFINKSDEDVDEATLYYFYTTWCPYCKVSKPEWNKLKEKSGGVINSTKIIFKEVDCDKDNNLADKYEVTGYPTIKLIYNNKIYNYDAKPSYDTLNEFLNSVIN